MNAPLRLSGSARSNLRAAVAKSPDWSAYRVTHGLQIATMTPERLVSAAIDLGIDLGKFVAAPDAASATATLAAESPRIESAVSVPSPAPVAEKVEQISASISAPRAGRAADLVAQAMAALAAETASPVDMDQVESAIDARMAGLVQSVAETAAATVAKAMASLPTLRIEVKGADAKIREVKGHKHPKFATLARVVSARMGNGYSPNVWLSGPAGSGKTHAGAMLAESLGLAFHVHGATEMPHELLGFIDAAGNYHRTPFREGYENGGVVMLDECDAYANGALLALNAGLANGSIAFPDTVVKRHVDCVIIASANTFGLGATAEYVGRAKLDAAFLSRFAVRIMWDYDRVLEVAISGNEAFAERVIAARAKARAAGLKVLIDPRASQAGGALISAGFSEQEAAELTYLANLTPDQRRTVEP